MDNVESLAQKVGLDNKRNICLLSALGTSNDVDSVASECLEEFSDNTRSVTHIFAYDGNRRKVANGADGLH